MKSAFWRLSAVSAILAALAVPPAHAQATSAVANGLSGARDNTVLAQRIIQLQAQLTAVERETLRRLNCQTNPNIDGIVMVSTDTGCKEVPGLRDYVGNLVAHPELQH